MDVCGGKLGPGYADAVVGRYGQMRALALGARGVGVGMGMGVVWLAMVWLGITARYCTRRSEKKIPQNGQTACTVPACDGTIERRDSLFVAAILPVHCERTQYLLLTYVLRTYPRRMRKKKGEKYNVLHLCLPVPGLPCHYLHVFVIPHREPQIQM